MDMTMGHKETDMQLSFAATALTMFVRFGAEEIAAQLGGYKVSHCDSKSFVLEKKGITRSSITFTVGSTFCHQEGDGRPRTLSVDFNFEKKGTNMEFVEMIGRVAGQVFADLAAVLSFTETTCHFDAGPSRTVKPHTVPYGM